MKRKYNYPTILSLLVLSIFFLSCAEDDTEIKILSARFTQTIDQNLGTVSFINTSENATSYTWDFGDGTNSSVINPVKTYTQGGTYTVILEVFNEDGDTATFQDTITIEELFDGGLLINGDFEGGSTGWIVGVDDNAPAPTVTEDNNTFYQVNITNPNPDQPFLVNVSQKLTINQGESYILTFDAWSDTNRTLIAGIGLSGPPFSNDIQTVNLTDSPQQFQVTLSAQEFGASDARVLFDSNGDVGLVRIDNVSLVVQ